eukprot:sb/3467895/
MSKGSGSSETSQEEEVYRNIEEIKNLYYGNKIKEAEEKLESYPNHPEYLVVMASLRSLRAGITFERQEIKEAVEKVESAKTVLESFRKDQGLASSILSLILSRNLNDFSVDELNCEAAYALMLMIKSTMSFIEGENFMNFVNGALEIRSSYSLYKELYRHLENAPPGSLDKHFVSSVCFGYGMYTLYLSMMPKKVLGMLEMVGLHGSLDEGKDILLRGEAVDGVRSDLSAMTIVHYNYMVCPFIRTYIMTEVKIKLVEIYVSSTEGHQEACSTFYAERS